MNPLPFELSARELLVFDARVSPLVIDCSAGELWITCEGDPVDYVVSAGKSVVLLRTGKVIIEALRPGRGQLRGVFSRSATRPHSTELAPSSR